MSYIRSLAAEDIRLSRGFSRRSSQQPEESRRLRSIEYLRQLYIDARQRPGIRPLVS